MNNKQQENWGCSHLIKPRQQRKTQLNQFSSSYFNANSVGQQMNSRLQSRPKPICSGAQKKYSAHDLYSRSQIAKQQKDQQKQQERQKAERLPSQCSFRPQTRRLSGVSFQQNVIKRNELWLQQRNMKNIQRREEIVMQDLNKCTFSPDMISSKSSRIYLKNKSQIKPSIKKAIAEQRDSDKEKSCIEGGKDISVASKRQITVRQYEAGKKYIFQRLNTLY